MIMQNGHFWHPVPTALIKDIVAVPDTFHLDTYNIVHSHSVKHLLTDTSNWALGWGHIETAKTFWSSCFPSFNNSFARTGWQPQDC